MISHFWPRPNPVPASEIEYTKRRARKEYKTASVPQIRARLAELYETVFERARARGTLNDENILVEYKRAEEEVLAEILRERLAKDKDLNATRHNPHKLSPTQAKTLRAIINAYDEAVAFELKRWGAESSEKLAKGGIDPVLYGPQATINALLSHGYLTLAGTSRHHTERLRKGAFGKFIGGVHHGEYVQQSVVPTQMGREA